jgi:hypothetical protein
MAPIPRIISSAADLAPGQMNQASKKVLPGRNGCRHPGRRLADRDRIPIVARIGRLTKLQLQTGLSRDRIVSRD